MKKMIATSVLACVAATGFAYIKQLPNGFTVTQGVSAPVKSHVKLAKNSVKSIYHPFQAQILNKSDYTINVYFGNSPSGQVVKQFVQPNSSAVNVTNDNQHFDNIYFFVNDYYAPYHVLFSNSVPDGGCAIVYNDHTDIQNNLCENHP